ncbi:MAG: tRNA lysidine(34) synthetase TilS, partial [Blastochloris sp.]|nr:tRNA lysidine(34) synthetase TilS [Blastochloris sp.]
VPFMVLHVNHGWRAEESEADAAWVRDWCRVHQRRVVLKKLSPRLPRTEGAARLARMEFFEQQARKWDLQEIWLAHHGDDVVETFLMQMLRGAGPEGLTALVERKRMGELIWVRPF